VPISTSEFEQPAKCEFVINLKTAKHIGGDDSAECVDAGGQSDQVSDVLETTIILAAEGSVSESRNDET
jgi:hypothetical protein